MGTVTTGQVMRYMILPGIIPRIMAFISSGFSHIALYMAYVYRGVRLLPEGHPYLRTENIGRYGIHHVIFEARRNLTFNKENIDQVIIFFSVLAGIVILFLEFFLLISGLMMGPVSASTYSYTDIFVVDDPTYDIAFRLLDLTFGFEDPYKIFNSCVINDAQCQLAFTPGGGYAPVGPTFDMPTQFHTALHTLFHFYNYGICVVGFMIGAYMIVTIVGETAQSGTPFGRRFNGMWAPIRLVIAIALLTPLSFGMNGAQLLTLVVAKWGSSMATNGWSEFMDNLNNMPIQQDDPDAPESLVARPTPPEINNLLEFMFVVHTCKNAERLLNQRGVNGKPEILGYQVFDMGTTAASTGGGGGGGGGQNGWVELDGLTFQNALENAGNGDIVIRFGVQDEDHFGGYAGYVKPICGELLLHTKSVDDTVTPGAYQMQEFYFEMVQDLWNDGLMDYYANNIALRYMPVADRDPFAIMPNNNFIRVTKDWFNDYIPDAIDDARSAQVGAPWDDEYAVLGWGGAGIWYQKIAEYTGSLFSSVYGVPTPHHYPIIMEHVKEQRRIQNDFVEGLDRYNPVLSDGNEVEWEEERDKHFALAYYYAQQFWWAENINPSANSFTDTILSVFGLNGLFEMRCNQDIHPLAQLVGVGRSLVESAVTNLGFTFGGVIAGSILDKHLVGSVAKSAAGFTGKVAMIGLSIGFILFYIVPFLPFIYFFFAVGGWIKGIFEAMVGLPLFALAHIRIDGEGLPGPVAMNGYFLVFEIFARPILIVFGMLAGILIFTAQVQILNEIWQQVTSNLAGYNTDPACANDLLATDAGVGPPVGSIDYLRGHADRFFHTVMYAILIYMLAMASFKLIDLIPNNILRWIGTTVSTFGEHSGDPAAKLVQHSYMGSNIALGPINQGIDGITSRAMPFL